MRARLRDEAPGRLTVADYRRDVAARLAEARPEDLPTLRALEAYGAILAERAGG